VGSLKKRVFVVDEHELMRRSIVEAIRRESDLDVCGQAGHAQQALAAIVLLQPDIVLTDIELKSSSGLDLIRVLRGNSPDLLIIATTMFDGLRNEQLAVAAGASGFVSKDHGPERLIATIHQTMRTGQKTAAAS
jgi:two-component system response regulator DevR